MLIRKIENLFNSKTNQQTLWEAVVLAEFTDIRDEDVQTLVKLGLNGVQARVYLSLLRTGPTKLKIVAKTSSVARPDVYRTISNLHELGLVERIVSTPAMFKGVPIQDAIYILMSRREQENSDLKKKTALLLENYSKEVDSTKFREDEHQFILISKQGPIISNLQRLADAAHKIIRVSLSSKRFFPLMVNYSDIFYKTAQRNVRIQILTDTPEEKENFTKNVTGLRLTPNFEVRMLPSPVNVHFSIFDETKIMLSVSENLRLGDVPAIYSNNPDIIELAKSYFEAKWQLAATPRVA